MAKVTHQIEQHLTANMNISKKDIVIGNFLGGVSWGVGTAIGAGVIFGLIGLVLNNLGVFDVFKSFPQVPQIYR